MIVFLSLETSLPIVLSSKPLNRERSAKEYSRFLKFQTTFPYFSKWFRCLNALSSCNGIYVSEELNRWTYYRGRWVYPDELSGKVTLKTARDESSLFYCREQRVFHHSQSKKDGNIGTERKVWPRGPDFLPQMRGGHKGNKEAGIKEVMTWVAAF